MKAKPKPADRTDHSPSDCDRELKRRHPAHAQAAHAEEWTCSCGRVYCHICDEAGGCFWRLAYRHFSHREKERSA